MPYGYAADSSVVAMNRLEQAHEPTDVWLNVSVVVSLSLAGGEVAAPVFDAVLQNLLPDDIVKECLKPLVLGGVLTFVALRRRTNPFRSGSSVLSFRGACVAGVAALLCTISVVLGARREVLRGLDLQCPSGKRA